MMEEKGVAPQRVVGLVMQLLKELREQRLELDDVELLSADLQSQGYTTSEINAAFNWVFARLDGQEPADTLYSASAATDSFRVLHPAERAVVRPDAFGLLLEMQTLSMLSMEDMERMIERAMAFGGPLTADDVMIIVHSYLFEEGAYSGPNGSFQYVTMPKTVH